MEALRRGDIAALRRQDMPTLKELADEFTAQHVAEPSTVASLKYRLRYALEGPKLDGKAGWQDVKIDRLNPTEIGAWRKALPARSAFGIHKALRQVLHYAVRAKLLDENPASLVPNPEPKRTEVQTFTLDELDVVSAELPARSGAPGLRGPHGSPAVRVDGARACRRRPTCGRRHRSAHRRRRCVKPYGKTDRSLRAVPLPARAAEALDEHPTRLDTRVLFPARVEGRWRSHRSVTASGTRRFGRRASSTARRTRCGTRTRASRSPRACPSSSFRGSWERRRR